jgi:4-hydroxy-3-polyprenylbenzoate decarboxylase
VCPLQPLGIHCLALPRITTSMSPKNPARDRTFVIGMSGGSGAVYALRLLEVLLADGALVQLVVSGAGRRVLQHEVGIDVDVAGFGYEQLVRPELRERLQVFDVAAVESTPASGSAQIDGVVLCPCSMGTLARVAHGFSTNLIERAGDVALKEGRRLVLVPRETPLSVIHLRNMLLLAESGAVVMPAMPGFYHRPREVGELVDFVVARILDRLDVEHDLVARWKTPDSGGEAKSPFHEGEDE